MTVSDVRGTGNSPETSDWLGGSDGLVALPIRAKLEVVVTPEVIEDVLTAIEEAARTGEPGDGKVFVEPVADAIRIRTFERGDEAI
jgi:nitrogen regulatory protein PII